MTLLCNGDASAMWHLFVRDKTLLNVVIQWRRSKCGCHVCTIAKIKGFVIITVAKQAFVFGDNK